MNKLDMCKVIEHRAHSHKPTWDGDNRCMIASIMPFLTLTSEQREVLIDAYGLAYDGQHSYEMESDGETLVHDKSFLSNIKIKNPAGVSHDAINRAPQHYLALRIWTPIAANRIYRELLRVFGYGPVRAWLRWLGVTVSIARWWR